MIKALLREIEDKSLTDEIAISICYKYGEVVTYREGYVIEINLEENYIKLNTVFNQTLCISNEYVISYEFENSRNSTQTPSNTFQIKYNGITPEELQATIEEVEVNLKNIKPLKTKYGIKLPHYDKRKDYEKKDLKQFNDLSVKIKNKFENAVKNKNNEKAKEAFSLLRANSKYDYFPEYSFNFVVLSHELKEINDDLYKHLTYLLFFAKKDSKIDQKDFHLILYDIYKGKDDEMEAFHFVKHFLAQDSFDLELSGFLIQLLIEKKLLPFYIPILEKFQDDEFARNYLFKLISYSLYKLDKEEEARGIFKFNNENIEESQFGDIGKTLSLGTSEVGFSETEKKEAAKVESYKKELEVEEQKRIIRENLSQKERNDSKKKSNSGESAPNEKVEAQQKLKTIISEFYNVERVNIIGEKLSKLDKNSRDCLYNEDFKSVKNIENFIQQYHGILKIKSFPKRKDKFEKWNIWIQGLIQRFESEESQFSDHFYDAYSRIADLGKKEYYETILKDTPDLKIKCDSKISLSREFSVFFSISYPEQNHNELVHLDFLDVSSQGGITPLNESNVIDKAISFGGSISFEIPFKYTLNEIQELKKGITITCRFHFDEYHYQYSEDINIELVRPSNFKPIKNPFKEYAELNIVKSSNFFIGRRELLYEIKYELINGEFINNYLIGEKYIGKSSILYHLKKEMLLEGFKIIELDIERIKSFKFVDLRQLLINQLNEKYDIVLDELSRKRTLSTFLKSIEGNILIVIEDFDLLLENILVKKEGALSFLESLIKIGLTSKARVIFSSSWNKHKLLHEEAEFFGNCKKFFVPTFGINDIVEYLKIISNTIGNGSMAQPKMAEKVFILSGGFPLIVQSIGCELIKYCNEKLITDLNLKDFNIIAEKVLDTIGEHLLESLKMDEDCNEISQVFKLVKNGEAIKEDQIPLLQIEEELISRGFLMKKGTTTQFTSELIKELTKIS